MSDNFLIVTLENIGLVKASLSGKIKSSNLMFNLFFWPIAQFIDF